MMLKLLKLIHLNVFIMWYVVYLIVLSVCSDLLYEIFYSAYHDYYTQSLSLYDNEFKKE